MKTKAQYKAANANDRVGFGGTINKGCSVPSRRSGNHPLLDLGGPQDPPFLYPSNPELTKKGWKSGRVPRIQSSHLENI